MLKRFVARLLIIAQVYGCFFQGIAHAATLVDEGGHQRHLFEETPLLGINEPEKLENFDDIHISKFTHLYSAINELGQLQFALGDSLKSSMVFTIPVPENPTDSFEYGGVTVTSQSTYFTFQGLNISIKNTGLNAGVMEVNGTQTCQSKPIFLSSNRSIIFSDVEADVLQIVSPQIVSRGLSTIDSLMLEGTNAIDGWVAPELSFINDGNLTAKKLFLNNLNCDNRGTILATSLGVIGELESSGVIEVDELALGENAFLKLGEDSRTDIKALFLSKASHLQNQQQADSVLNIGVLSSSIGGLGGSITNHGTMVIAEIAQDSAFQEISNRHFMGIAQGDIKVETLSNSGAFGIEQGSLRVRNGTNSGVLKTNGLEVTTEFTNNKGGVVTTPLVSGTGELLNLGKIEATENLALDGQKFTNSTGGSVKSQTLTGLAGLQQFTNAEEASIEVTQALGFDQTTKVINQGFIKSHNLTLFGKQTTQEGGIRVSNLELTGGGEFVNFGDIDVEQGFNLELGSFINKGNLSTTLINGHENLITLKNDSGSLFKVRDGPLELANTTALENAGTIEAQSLNLHSDQTTIQKSGILKAANISLTGVKPFTNSGQILASQKLVLDLPSFTNQKTVESPLIDISKVAELINAKDAVIDAQGSDLTFSKAAKVVNEGNLKARDYLFKGGSLAQNGRIDGRSLKIEDIVVTTTDSQIINLSGDLEQSGISEWIMRGKFNARKFFKIGDINLYGTLTLADSFRGAGTIHQGGNLITKRASFYSNVTLDGDLEVDTLDFDKPASKFNLNGKASIRQNAKIGRLKVGKDGVLQGINGNVLSLTLAEDSEIAGLVDVDNLEADKEITLTSTGKLIALKKAQLQADLKIAKGGAANLTGLVMGGTIYNDGEFKAVQGSGMSRLVNRGVAEIEADHSTYGQDKDLKLWLRNEKSGQLTLTRGDFDMRGDNPFENAGILIDNSRWMWLGKPQNSGIWYSPSCSLKRYNGMDMGDFRVDGDLTVESLVDALKALEGLQKTKAKKVILHAPKIDNAKTVTPVNPKPINKTYPWPLEMRIEGDVNNSFEIFAPELSIYCRNLKTSADIFTLEKSLQLDVTDTLDINARIGSLDETVIKAKRLKIFGRESIPGASAPNVLYKRNGNGIYSKARVRLNITELLENRYGTIHGMYFDITGSKDSQLINLAGLIVGDNPYIGSWIKVTNIKNLRDDQGSYTTTVQQIYNSGGKNWCWCGTRPFYCCHNGYKNISHTYETSDEGVIFSQGYLRFTYNYLEMLASRITCGKELTFRAEGKAVVYKDGDVPLNTKMIARNNHVNHIVAKKDIKADVGNGDIASSFNGANIFVNAAKLTLQNLGLQPNQLGQVVNLSSQALRALPFDTKTLMPSTMVILGKNADQFNQDVVKKQGGKQDWDKAQEEIILKDNISALQQAMGSSFYTLYRGIDGLGIDPHQLFKSMFSSSADHVRGHKATQSHKRYLTAGDQTQEIEVLTNPVITPQDLLDSGILGVFLEFAQNIHSLESEQKANRDIINATMHFAIPEPAYKTDGLNTKGDVGVISQGNLRFFTNARGKNVALVSTEGSTTVGSGTVRHHWGESYHDTLVRTHIEATDNILIQGETDVNLKAVETKSGIRTDIIAKTGMVVDESVATINHTVTHSQTKDSFTTTKVTNVHQNVSTHASEGTVNVKAKTGILQQGTKNINTTLDAPIILQDDVHDQTFVESITESRKKSGGFFGSLFNIRETKTTNFNSYLSTSMGCHNSGESFIVMAKERFKAVNPTFGAKETHIYAEDANGERSGQIEIDVGTNTNQSQTQSIFKGVVWNKSSLKTENHVTHQNPTFEHNVYLHSPNVILERVRGSQGTFDKIISDSEIIFKDVDDIHQSTSKSQKCLAGGAALLTKLAVGIAMMYAMPVGAFGLTGTTSLMVNAGFATLCSDATVCLVENDGDPGKAIKALSKSKIAMNVARSMLTAGLVGEISDVVGLPSTNLELIDYAQKATIQSAVNTVLAVSIDGQNFEKALMQGMTTAALSTATSYLANQIGQSYFDKQLNWLEHKTLHALLGGLSGGVSSKLFGGSFERGAISGALGAVVAEAVAEMIKPDLTNEMISSQEKGLSREEFEKAFMEKAQQSSKWSDFVGAVSAFGMGLDTNIAYQTSNNATENNFLPGILLALTVGSTVYEGYQIQQTYKNEGGEAALKHLGITVVSAVVVGGTATVGFKVGKAVYPSLHEAYKAAVASRPMLASALTALELRLGKIEKYVKDQFNYKEFFAAERLRLEGGIKPKTYKGGKYAEAEDVVPHGNSRQYVGDTHVYAIKDAETGQVYKVGESMQGLNKFGLSKRAKAQANKLRKETGQKYETEIR